MFSHYRQYEQWRKRQFSYDSYHYRPLAMNAGGATRRRRMYKRQFSYVERSEGSRDSHDSKYYITASEGPTKRDSVNSFDGIDGVPIPTNSAVQSINRTHFHLMQEEPSATIAERCTRSRINSAIFVSSEGRGFDSIEFLRRHGSQSVLCRKAKSAENITDGDRKRRFSENRQWDTEDSSHPSETIELTECCQMPPSVQPAAVAIVSTNGLSESFGGPYLTTVTTANTIVGSISIETPPMHIQQELLNQTQQRRQTSPPPSGSQQILDLKSINPKIGNLPTLSVSGPSPPHEEKEDFL